MDSRHVQHLIDGYLDGEFDLSASLEIERHLQGCSSCQSAYQERQTLVGRIRSEAPYYGPPPGLAAKIAADLDRPPVRAGTRSSGLVRPLAVAASLLLAVLAGSGVTYLAMRPSTDDGIAREVTDSHVRAMLVDAHRVDVSSSDEHTVKPWFNGKLDYAPPVNDWTRDGFPLVGGRLDYVGGRPVAVLIYRHRQHLISLFVWPAAEPSRAQAPTLRERRGYPLLTWSSGGMRFWLVSDLNAAELEMLQRLVQGP